jgi:hypothetical protein
LKTLEDRVFCFLDITNLNLAQLHEDTSEQQQQLKVLIFSCIVLIGDYARFSQTTKPVWEFDRVGRTRKAVDSSSRELFLFTYTRVASNLVQRDVTYIAVMHDIDLAFR